MNDLTPARIREMLSAQVEAAVEQEQQAQQRVRRKDEILALRRALLSPATVRQWLRGQGLANAPLTAIYGPMPTSFTVGSTLEPMGGVLLGNTALVQMPAYGVVSLGTKGQVVVPQNAQDLKELLEAPQFVSEWTPETPETQRAERLIRYDLTERSDPLMAQLLAGLLIITGVAGLLMDALDLIRNAFKVQPSHLNYALIMSASILLGLAPLLYRWWLDRKLAVLAEHWPHASEQYLRFSERLGRAKKQNNMKEE
ncbi:hypothetical protein Dxin01_00790 [Deinococcus xinjiangensis]|uniref:Uncharacterized protein n=1 Tax=Deinococcus xinjiangensis TaxID=457454 RepID=A0ABP9V708_9DEIO